MKTERPGLTTGRSPLHPEYTPRVYPAARLSDSDLLAEIEPIYEHACWLAEISAVDFDPFAGLAVVIAELRLRTESAA
jgi:2-oxo-4-hydroxy-4-carboxy--5-ureidoimidazoline (OHCU) decarboxylase